MLKYMTAKGGESILIKVTPQEFRKITNKPAVDVADGTEISLDWLSKVVSLTADNRTNLADIKVQADELSASIAKVLNGGV